MMSNDLISRKEAVKLVIAEYDRFQANGGSYSGRHELDRVIKMLQNMPTVFNKEKVIEKIHGVPHGIFNVETENEIIEIVEKGGIE